MILCGNQNPGSGHAGESCGAPATEKDLEPVRAAGRGSTDLAPVWRSLVEAHDRVENIFAEHQKAIVNGSLAEAAAHFRAFRSIVMEHLDMEETCLLPAYLENPAPPRGGGVEIFRAEHRQIARFVEALGDVVEGWTAAAKLSAGEVIRLIEDERVLKHLLEHHDLRKRQYLYPWLNAHDREGRALQSFPGSERLVHHAV